LSDRQPISPAHSSGARSHRIVEAFQREREVRAGHDMGREPAIPREAGEDRPVAQVLPVRRTVGTVTAGASEPWHADARAEACGRHVRTYRLDDSDDLVTGHDRMPDSRKIAVENMEVGSA
jgi:hypothetical protein